MTFEIVHKVQYIYIQLQPATTCLDSEQTEILPMYLAA